MLDIFFKCIAKYNNIVNICLHKAAVAKEELIYILLGKGKSIAKPYQYYVKLFKSLVANNNYSITVLVINKQLIEKAYYIKR